MTVKELISTCCMEEDMIFVGHYDGFTIHFNNLGECIEENLDNHVTNWKIIRNTYSSEPEFHMWIDDGWNKEK